MLRAFLRLPVSCHPPETSLLTSDYSHSLPPCFTHHQSSFPPSCPSSLSFSHSISLSLLCTSRFSASFQAGFKQLCETSKCPSLCGLFRKDDNDIPNPADLQLIAPLRHPSTIILRRQTPLLFHLWLHRLDLQVPYLLNKASDFLLLMLISISAYRKCLALQPRLFLPPLLSPTFLSCVSSLILAASSFPHDFRCGCRKHASHVR